MRLTWKVYLGTFHYLPKCASSGASFTWSSLHDQISTNRFYYMDHWQVSEFFYLNFKKSQSLSRINPKFKENFIRQMSLNIPTFAKILDCKISTTINALYEGYISRLLNAMILNKLLLLVKSEVRFKLRLTWNIVANQI